MQVTAKSTGFYGLGLKAPGETFTLAKEEHFSRSWMVKGTEAPAMDEPKYTGYSAARGAAGKFVVKDAAGQMVGTFTGNKAEAEAEAERLNGSGAIKGTEAPAMEGSDGDGDGLPDA